ncbi:MAG TPA: putative peptidoglycan glycosyltransferase FtsW [Tepidisphaeraceae bacterium]|jgi:cell division protein FtsW
MDDSIYRIRNHDLLMLALMALLGLSVVMVQSASASISGDFSFNLTDLASKQLMFAGVGLVLFWVIRRTDYIHLLPGKNAILTAPPLWLMAIAAVACVAVLVPGIGIEKNGARRWLPLGIMQLQPSELAKWATVVFLAWWLTHRPINLDRFGNFVLTLVPIGFLCLLVVIQDFGTAALIAVVALGMMFVGRVKTWHLGVVLPPVMLAAYWFVAHKEYRWKRMTAFLDPYAAPQGEGYHMIQSLLSYATGGLSGTGLGGGIQKLGYLPEDTTDFIFSTICEELGFFGAATVIGLYLMILILAWQAMKQPRDAFGRLLGFGIGMMICTQAAINVAVATVSVPTKGLSLPLISSGGSGLIIACAAMGLLGSVLRHSHAPAPARKPAKARKTAGAQAQPVGAKQWAEWTAA